eukprot:TRINITY_DN55317_c0_g1_i1.p1 TRINITY_DN55317_c0_g1~~TRINITY_DN55317_c0_g1_i1.p1  ORF type:complete len:598 (+),score=99.29 TRINITY_DN55317_c0_g1_i1:75-1868(+)
MAVPKKRGGGSSAADAPAKSPQAQCAVLLLDDAVLAFVCSFLPDLPTHAHLSWTLPLVCRRFNKVAQSEWLWKDIAMRNRYFSSQWRGEFRRRGALPREERSLRQAGVPLPRWQPTWRAFVSCAMAHWTFNEFQRGFPEHSSRRRRAALLAELWPPAIGQRLVAWQHAQDAGAEAMGRIVACIAASFVLLNCAAVVALVVRGIFFCLGVAIYFEHTPLAWLSDGPAMYHSLALWGGACAATALAAGAVGPSWRLWEDARDSSVCCKCPEPPPAWEAAARRCGPHAAAAMEIPGAALPAWAPPEILVARGLELLWGFWFEWLLFWCFALHVSEWGATLLGNTVGGMVHSALLVCCCAVTAIVLRRRASGPLDLGDALITVLPLGLACVPVTSLIHRALSMLGSLEPFAGLADSSAADSVERAAARLWAAVPRLLAAAASCWLSTGPVDRITRRARAARPWWDRAAEAEAHRELLLSVGGYADPAPSEGLRRRWTWSRFLLLGLTAAFSSCPAGRECHAGAAAVFWPLAAAAELALLAKQWHIMRNLRIVVLRCGYSPPRYLTEALEQGPRTPLCSDCRRRALEFWSSGAPGVGVVRCS